MAATRKEVNEWIKLAKENDIEYIISVCDTFDFDDYPVYCKNTKELKRKLTNFNDVNMQRINEIIQINNGNISFPAFFTK